MIIVFFKFIVKQKSHGHICFFFFLIVTKFFLATTHYSINEKGWDTEIERNIIS